MVGIWITVTVAALLATYLGYLFVFQSRYVYYPESTMVADPSTIGLSFEDVSFHTGDGIKLFGWFIPNKESKGVVLFCHGNAGNISHRLDSIQILHQLGLDVFIFDYRGYGRSEGKPSEQGTYQDTEAAWWYLTRERHVLPSNIIVIGRSLGGAIAAWLAMSYTPGALILESSFTSLADIATKLHPYLPLRQFLRFRYTTTDYLYQVKCPVLIIHSRDDELMPFEYGIRLFEIASEPKRFLEISGSHNDGFVVSGKQYQRGLNTFITDYIYLKT
jgi:pimeloyl-ACP methyl ester carboxylesterase